MKLKSIFEFEKREKDKVFVELTNRSTVFDKQWKINF